MCGWTSRTRVSARQPLAGGQHCAGRVCTASAQGYRFPLLRVPLVRSNHPWCKTATPAHAVPATNAATLPLPVTLHPSLAGVVNIFGPNQEEYHAAEARILGLAGESVKVCACWGLPGLVCSPGCAEWVCPCSARGLR